MRKRDWPGRRTAGVVSALLIGCAAWLGAAAEPVISAPAEDEVIDLVPASQREFLAGRTSAVKKSKGKPVLLGKAEDSHPEKVVFSWPDAGLDDCRLILSESPAFETKQEYPCAGKTSLAIENLKCGTVYYARLTGTIGGKNVCSPVRKFRTLDRPPRWIHVPGISNVRDCGGWKTKSGARVRQGMMFRGSAMDGKLKITPEGKKVMRELGIRTDLDLRAPKELKNGPVSALASEGVRFEQAALIGYIKFLSSPKAKVNAKAFRIFTDRRNYPVYFHCAGGADRTGTLNFMLLAVLGVSDEDLLKEYELTTFSYYGKRLRTDKAFREFLEKFDTYAPGRDFATKAEAYFRSIGITDRELTAFREIMLEKGSK